MEQINSDQIVSNQIPENTIKPIPRDLQEIVSSRSGSGLNSVNLNLTNIPLSESDSVSSMPSAPLPDTPAFIGVKQQTVKIKPDGTYAIDIIIEVEDVMNVSDYEVRISKGAGNI